MKLFLVFLLSFVFNSALAEPFVLAYSGSKFYLPSNPVAVGSLPTIIIVKYSMESGKQYISATVEDSLDVGSCGYQEFFDNVLKSPSNYFCGEKETKSFQYVFMRETESGSWIKEGKYYYYFMREKGQESRVFIINKGELIMMASDFLTIEEWKQLF